MRPTRPQQESRVRNPGARRTARRGRIARAASIAVLLCAGPTLAESISGVCPDGSIFIVRSAAAIPCGNARQVAPDEMPPIKPQYLPRPWAWQAFQARQDPNNPYNLVGEAGAEGALAGQAPPPAPAPSASAGAPAQAPAATQVAAAVPSTPAGAPELARTEPPSADLALSNDEIRALVAIVELSQARAPATLAEPDASDPELLLRLARSPAFEARLREAWTAAGQPVDGSVVVFAAEARAAAAFHANLTFAQGHVAYHPDPSDRRQFGLLRGREGALEAGEITLGYVVLPGPTDLAEPIDIYWNDRRITAVLAPAS